MGYLKPVYSRFDVWRGHWQHGYHKPEFDKIVQGYACGNCGEDYEGQHHDICPVCRLPTGGGTDEGPPEWRN